MKSGGLGVQDVSLSNLTLLGKLVWDILQDSHKLWVLVICHKCLSWMHILNDIARPGASSFRRGLLKARDLLRGGFKFRLSNGETSSIHTNSNTTHYLKDVIRNGGCDLSSPSTVLPVQFEQTVLAIQLVLDPRCHGIWVWTPCRHGLYLSDLAYNWLNQRHQSAEVTEDWSWVWTLRAP